MNKQKQWSSLKVISYIVTVIFLLSVIPLLWIGIYNFPSSDDFSMGMAARQVWQQNHSVFATIIEAIRETGRLYLGWAGTYSTILFMTMCPAVFGEKAYVIVPYLMIGFLSFSMWYFFRVMMIKVLRADKYLTNIISMLVLLFTIQTMPSVVEGYYWFNGAVHYIFPYSFLLLFISILIKAETNREKKSIAYIILLSLLGIFVGGGNFMTALLIILICCLFILKWILLKEKNKKLYFLPMCITFIAFIINILAPGNSVRQGVSSGLSPIKAIYMSFYESMQFILNYTFSWRTVCFILLLLPLVWLVVKGTGFSFKYPILVLIVSYCILSAVFTPCLYGVGNVVAGRLQNTIYISYILALVLNIFYILGWFCKLIMKRKTDMSMKAMRFVAFSIACASMLTILVSVFFIQRNPDYYAASSAIVSLKSGQAAQYGNECRERLSLLLDQNQKDIVLQPYTNPPSILFFEDITGDPNDWRNKAISEFYGKNSVILLQ